MALLVIYGRCTHNVEVLRDGAALAIWLRSLVVEVGMVPVGDALIQQFAHWKDGPAPSVAQFLDDGLQGGGCTVAWPLAESAALTHSYPETPSVEVMLDTCDDIPNVVTIAEGIRNYWGLQVPVGGLIYEAKWGWKTLRNQDKYLPNDWPRNLVAHTNYTVLQR